MLKFSLFAVAALFAFSMAGVPASAQTSSSLYVQHADLMIAPAALTKYIELLKGHAESTIREPGVIEFNISQIPTDPNHLVLLEVYREKADYDAHHASEEYKNFNIATKGMVTGVVIQPLTPLEIHSKAH